MRNYQTDRRKPTSLLGLAVCSAAVVLGAAGVGGLWFGLAAGRGWPVLLAGAVLAGAVVWLSRARAARRWQAALDAYAKREIIRARRRKTRPRVTTVSARAEVRGIFREAERPRRGPG
jgi:hypothetical protein